jgi:cell fate regulator YaaT (PSP1 superfamily)
MIVQIKVVPWDKSFEYDTDNVGHQAKAYNFAIGDFYIIKMDSHSDLGEVVGLKQTVEVNPNDQKKDQKDFEEIAILRKATPEDFEKKKEKDNKKSEFLKKAGEIVQKFKLNLRLADIHLSLDGGKIVFAFLAPDRVDFRDLVKELSQEFHRSIRLHQINPREEIKIFSGIGSCGYPVCCLSFLKNLGGVKTTLIEEQQLQHRGVDRLSGLCGRLKCCLAYEKNHYQEQMAKMPPLGKQVKVNGKMGKVLSWHILKGTVDFKDDKEETIVEVPVEDIKE